MCSPSMKRLHAERTTVAGRRSSSGASHTGQSYFPAATICSKQLGCMAWPQRGPTKQPSREVNRYSMQTCTTSKS